MSPVVFTDADFVRLALEEPERFLILEQRYRRIIIDFLEHQFPEIKKMDLAEDVADDVFGWARRGLQKLEKPHRFCFWIRGIAFNVGRKRLRKIKNRRKAEMAAAKDHEAEMLSESAAPDANIRCEIIQKMVERLPAGDKEMIRLKFYEKHRFREISKILGIPLATLHERFERLYKTLRARLKDYEVEHGSWHSDYEHNKYEG